MRTFNRNYAVLQLRYVNFIPQPTVFLQATAGFWLFFSAPVISQIDFIGVGRWEEGGGRWGAKGRVKYPFGLKE